jgi:HEAT repeat protein
MSRRFVAALSVVVLLSLIGCSRKCKVGDNPSCWIKALKDPEQAEAAIDNLRQLGDKAAEPALIEAFQNASEQPEQREKIAEIFNKWQTKSAVKPLLDAIDFTIGPNKDGRKAKRTNRANEKIASALGALGDVSAGPALLKLMDNTKEPTVQRAAMRGLAKLKYKDAVDELIKRADNESTSQPDRVLRINALYALGEIADPKAVPTLIKALFREKSGDFFYASLSLVKIGEPVIEPLIKTMNGENQDVMPLVEQTPGALESKAAKVLGDIGNEKATTALLHIAEKIQKWDIEPARDQAMSGVIAALGALGDKRGLPLIQKYLRRELWDLRSICSNAINLIGDRSQVSELLRVSFSNDQPRTRTALIEALGNLGTSELLTQLKEQERAQKDLDILAALKDTIKRLEAYSECKQDVSCWIGKLSDANQVVREKAVYELGRSGDQKAVDPLLKIIADESENVRFALIFAFDKLKSRKAIEPLEELVENEKGSPRFKVVNFNYQILTARLGREAPPESAPSQGH